MLEPHDNTLPPGAGLDELNLAPLTTPLEIRRWDADSVALGVPGEMLMENAAQAARRVLQHYVPDMCGLECALIMGAGNNGGDAACLSRQLLDLGASVTVWHTRPLETVRGDTAFHVNLARRCGVTFRPAAEYCGQGDVLVDGLLGTGFSGSLREDVLDLVHRCNSRRRRFTLGLDIPSGLDAMTGLPCPEAVICDATATFAAAKPGLVLPEAQPYTGALHVCYIGTPRAARLATPASFALLNASCLHALKLHVSGGWKNVYGHVYVVGGAHGLAGAAHIAALAALRGGAGLVTAVTPASAATNVKNGRAEIMICQAGTDIWPDALPEALSGMGPRSSLVIGPGMGRSADAERFLDLLLRLEERPCAVLDADALWHLAHNPEWRSRLKAGDVLTPHPGEAKTLLDGAQVTGDRAKAAREIAARFGCVCVLKGDVTLLTAPDAPLIVHPADVPQLSCGGSGDCLAGLTGALLCRGNASLVRAAQAVAWHSLAGRHLAATYPLRGNLAGEIADALPLALACDSSTALLSE